MKKQTSPIRRVTRDEETERSVRELIRESESKVREFLERQQRVAGQRHAASQRKDCT